MRCLIRLMLLSLCAAPMLLGRPAFAAGEKEDFMYASFRDVPEVTEEEIRAVEELQRQGVSFLYGTIVSTETFPGPSGEIRGFTPLLCQWMSEFFGLSFKTALYEWDDMLAGLDTGEIDFTGELTATEERRKTYLMTEAIAERLVKYIRIGGSERLSDIAKRRKPRFAFLAGVTTVDDVRARLGESFEASFVGGYVEAYDLLQGGRVDAFIDESTAEAVFDMYGDVVVEDFYPLIYGPVSLATRNTANRPIISIMQKFIKNGGMRHLVGLYKEGQAEYIRHKLALRLTAEERAFIEGAPGVKFAAENDNYPVSFYNEYDKRFQGAFHDVLAEVAALTGLRFEAVNGPGDDWSKILAMLESGEAALISELIRNPEREGHFLWADTPLMTDYYALLSKTDIPNVTINEVLYMRVGLVEGYAPTEIFRSWFPGHADTVLYPDFVSAFEGLDKGEVDLIMGGQNQLLIQTNYRELPGYKANIVFDYPFDSLIGLNRNEAVLRSIFDKALHLIHTRDISGGWMRRTYDYRAKLVRSRLPWLIGAVVSLSGVLLLLIVLFRRSRREVGRMVRFQNVIMETMAELVEYRDGTTGGHIGRTSAYLELMLNALKDRGLFQEETAAWNVRQMVLSAQLHDVGKVAIPDNILGKPGPLTDDEFEAMKRHTLVGGEIIEKIQSKTSEKEFLDQAVIFARHHHEKWDGTGYPDGLKGAEIPLAARLLAIIDVYDALISDRPYKKAFTPEEAAKIIGEGKGKHFDPLLTDVFLEVIL